MASLKLYHSRKALGICVRCEGEVVPGKSMCEFHTEETRKKCLETYHKQKAIQPLPRSAGEFLPITKHILTDEQKDLIDELRRSRKLLGFVCDKLGAKTREEFAAISSYYYSYLRAV
ncbi:MAG: hypothetical protein WCL30_04365 [Pseudomonadota bacterium]